MTVGLVYTNVSAVHLIVVQSEGGEEVACGNVGHQGHICQAGVDIQLRCLH